uniref:Bromo domain-containing protein n=1 Tax=Leersia perrieri TaxID=77586 RepID=A0A0D9X9M7_9ORYZ
MACGTDRAEGMTARSDDPGVSPESSAPAAAQSPSASAAGEIWGTSEDLLLACAVNRHGTASWDAVANEVRSRFPSAAADAFTPDSCRLRFRLLHRRFSDTGGDGGGEEEVEPDADAVAGWVEELRKLRVAELRREVEKYDLSIGSLQSKVKRLKEERERSISGETKSQAAAAAKEETEEGEDVRKGSPEEEEAGGVEDRVSGHESGRSCKESNSSDLKRPENDDPAAANDDDNPAAAREEKAVKEEVAVKEEASGESVAGSKEAAAADAEKESSDVQSSASPSRRRRKGVAGGEETEEASPSVSVAIPAAEAEPLVAFLESIRTSKAGAVFERRLESQEGEGYSGTIRRHVDLETIRSRLTGGATPCYASASELYRDLLLLCANALVFFPRASPEHAAAIQIRGLVSNRIISKIDRPPAVAAGNTAETSTKKPKADADIAGSLLEKPPIIVCRKRSSIAKAAAAKGEKSETIDKKEKDGEEKKKPAATAAAASKDKKAAAATTARGMRTNKSRGQARNQKTAKVSESGEGSKKSDKKAAAAAAAAAAGGVAKKRNAVDFLNRMNQNGSPSTERVSLLETLKLSAAATEQQNKKSSASSSSGKPGGSGTKKGASAAVAATPPGRRIGRPPKRGAAPPTPPPSKRAKEDKPTRKRGKK